MPFVDITIRYLELTRETFNPKLASRGDLTFSRVDPPMPELNRFFYAAIGGMWFWLDRRRWTLEDWKRHLNRTESVETWVLAVDGIPAGFVEFERCDNGAVEISYLGLLSTFIGQGLGAHLVTCGVGRAFAMGAQTVRLNTCNLDHPQAYANYMSRGFQEVRMEVKSKDVPKKAPGPWDGA